MGENVWDFRKRLTLLLASAVIIAVVFFIFKVLFYYVWPFLIAFCFAVLLQKPIVGLAKLLREKKTLAASIVVTMVTLIILSVLLYVGYMAFRELKDFIANFDELYRERIRPKKIYKMIHSEIGQRMAAAGKSDRLYRERQFYMMMKPGEIMSSLKDCGDETIVVQGIIDAYFEEDGGIVLLDYKTDSVKDASELVKRYHVQLDKYADVLEQLTGMKVKEKVIYSFCLDTTVNL